MDWNHLLLSFDGRISRQPFWIGFALLFAAEVAAQSLAQRIEGDRLGAIVDLAFTYPEFALFAKRAHDRNTPIWLLGVFFAVGVALNFLSIMGWGGSLEERTPLFMVRTTLSLRCCILLRSTVAFSIMIPCFCASFFANMK